MKIKFNIKTKLKNGTWATEYKNNTYEYDGDYDEVVEGAKEWAMNELRTEDVWITDIELIDWPSQLEIIDDTMEHTSDHYGDVLCGEEALIKMNDQLHNEGAYIEVMIDQEEMWIVNKDDFY